jgi:serine phosphatase RsbU (regulator of sigma subunit)
MTGFRRIMLPPRLHCVRGGVGLRLASGLHRAAGLWRAVALCAFRLLRLCPATPLLRPAGPAPSWQMATVLILLSSGLGATPDTTRIKALLDSGIAANYAPDVELPAFQKAAFLAEKIRATSHQALALKSIGVVHYFQGEYHRALEYWIQSNTLYAALGKKQRVANNLNNIGNVYLRLGEYAKALQEYRKCLSISTELNNRRGMAAALGNMGNVYDKTGERQKALLMHKRSYSLDSADQHREGMANSLTNMGAVYQLMGKSDMAFERYSQALEIFTSLGDSLGIATSLSNLGSIYHRAGNFTLAVQYQSRSLELHRRLGNVYGICISLNNLSDILLRENKLPQALENYREAYKLAGQNGLNDVLHESIQGMYQIYDRLGQAPQALAMLKRYNSLSDSLLGQEKLKELARQEMLYEYDKMVLRDSVERVTERRQQEAERERTQLELERQKDVNRLLYAIGGILLVGSVLLLLLARALRRSGNARKIALHVTRQQALMLEAKNREISQSMQYGSMLQQQYLPGPEQLQGLPLPAAAWLSARDELGGDFYWAEAHNNRVWAAVADCTGHGIPGAMLTIMAWQGIREALPHASTPAELLKRLHAYMRTHLSQRNQRELHDGLDISVVCINTETKTLLFCAARNNGYLIRNGESITLAAARRSIGMGVAAGGEEFVDVAMPLQSGDQLWLFTDGIIDQFGGDDQKVRKFGTKRLLRLLCEPDGLNEKCQRTELALSHFIGLAGEVRIDDVCLLGIGIP